MGAVILPLIALYFALLVWATWFGWRWAKARGWSRHKRWLGAACGFLIVYLLVFWDLLPTLIAEKYNCATESGVFQYKTVNQWKAQNPGVMETLSVAHLPEKYRIDNDPIFRNDNRYLMPDGTLLTTRFDVRNRLMNVEYKKPEGESGLQLNERLRQAYKHEGPGLIKLSRREYILVDIGTNEVLARQVDFHTTTKGKIWSTLGDSDWKFWFQSPNSCIKDYPQSLPDGGIGQYVRKFDTDCPGKRAEDTERDGVKISCPWRP